MNVLQMLQARLMQNAGWAEQEEGQGGDPRLPPNLEEILRSLNRGPPAPDASALPADLPDAVRRSILTQPSYAEGQRVPGTMSALMGQEFANVFGPQRDAELLAALQQRNRLNEQGGVRQEAGPWPGSAPSYPDPLNSMMGRYPLALY